MKEVFSSLQKAIKDRKVIRFDYSKDTWNLSHREWHPYALYTYKDKKWNESTKIDFVQTDWDSDSKDNKPFPSFRWFIDIRNILNLEILEGSFYEPWHIDYVPESERYINSIIKI